MKSYEEEIQHNLNPLNYFTKTKEVVELCTSQRLIENHERV